MKNAPVIGLLPKEVKFYQKYGYCLPNRPLFREKDFNELKSIFEEHLANRGDKRSDELDTPHFQDPRLLRFLLHEDVLDVVESLLGPDIGLFSSHFISKEPFTGRKTPWHEDSAYWEGKFARLDKIVTVWLALDPAFRENGCMGVIPGTHVNGFSDYEAVGNEEENTFDTQIRANAVDESKAVWFELSPGTYSLHDARIIHGAGANRSPQRRAGYTMRYFSLDLKFNPESAPGHRLYHARGKNVAENPLEYLPNSGPVG